MRFAASSGSALLGLVTLFSAFASVACTASSADEAASGASAQSTNAGPPTVEAADGQICPPPGEVTETEIKETFGGPWKEPPAPTEACTQADIDKVKALFAQSSRVKFAEMKAAVSPACGSCVFTPSSASAWGVLVVFPDGVYENYGACHAHASNADCAENVAYFATCVRSVCNESSCGSSQATSRCEEVAAVNGCRTFTTAVQKSCGDWGIENIERRCTNIFQSIAVTCGGGLYHKLNTTP